MARQRKRRQRKAAPIKAAIPIKQRVITPQQLFAHPLPQRKPALDTAALLKIIAERPRQVPMTQPEMVAVKPYQPQRLFAAPSYQPPQPSRAQSDAQTNILLSQLLDKVVKGQERAESLAAMPNRLVDKAFELADKQKAEAKAQREQLRQSSERERAAVEEKYKMMLQKQEEMHGLSLREAVKKSAEDERELQKHSLGLMLEAAKKEIKDLEDALREQKEEYRVKIRDLRDERDAEVRRLREEGRNEEAKLQEERFQLEIDSLKRTLEREIRYLDENITSARKEAIDAKHRSEKFMRDSELDTKQSLLLSKQIQDSLRDVQAAQRKQAAIDEFSRGLREKGVDPRRMEKYVREFSEQYGQPMQQMTEEEREAEREKREAEKAKYIQQQEEDDKKLKELEESFLGSFSEFAQRYGEPGEAESKYSESRNIAAEKYAEGMGVGGASLMMESSSEAEPKENPEYTTARRTISFAQSHGLISPELAQQAQAELSSGNFEGPVYEQILDALGSME